MALSPILAPPSLPVDSIIQVGYHDIFPPDVHSQDNPHIEYPPKNMAHQVAEPTALRLASFNPRLPPIPFQQSTPPLSTNLPLHPQDTREHRGQEG